MLSMGNPDPEDVEKAFDAMERIEEEIEGDEGDTEQIEDEVSSEESKTEQSEEKVAEEIKDSEEKNSKQELEDAEKKEQKILNALENQEKLIERTIESIEHELKAEQKVENIASSSEDFIMESFESALENLEKIFVELKKFAENGGEFPFKLDTILYRAENLRGASKELYKLIQHYERFIRELEETEKEQFQLEELESELRTELDLSYDEISEFIADTEQIKDADGKKVALNEESTLEGLISEWKDEEKEMEKIDQKLQDEIQRMEAEIEELEELLNELETGIELINSIEKFIQDNSDTIAYRFDESDYTYEQFMTALDDTRQELVDLYGEEVDEVRELESEEQSAEQGYEKVIGALPGGGGDSSRSLGVSVVVLSVAAIAVLLFFI